MTRIRSTNIRFGDNFVLPIEKAEEEKPESPELLKLKENLRILNLEIEEAKKTKAKILEEAENESKALIAEATNKITAENEEIAKQREAEKKTFEENLAQEAEKIKSEAYQTGYDDGYKQGYVVITNELEAKVHAVDNFVKCQFDLKNNIIKSSELDIINLVIEIAKKVCSKTVELNPDILKVLTENAIKELKDKENITIIINPQLLDAINSVSDKLKEEIPQLKNIKIIEDASVSADGTIVESPLTRVDSRVKSQINEIAEKLFEAYNSEDESFENYMASFEDHDINALEQIELSDDVNINEFLNELEDIPTYENKLRDEDAEYYENLDLEELKKSDSEMFSIQDENSKENEIDNLNVDDYEEEVPTEKFENQQQIEEPEIISEEISDTVQNDNNTELSVQDEVEKPLEENLNVENNVNLDNVLSEVEKSNENETISSEDISSIKEELEKMKDIETHLPKKPVESFEPEISKSKLPKKDEKFTEIEDEVFQDLDINEKFDKLFPLDNNNLMGGEDVQ